MPHRKSEERPGGGARRQGEGDNRSKTKDNTPVSHGTEANAPEGRKSGWVRLSDILPDPDSLLRQLLESAASADAEPGDGLAMFLPDGETVLLEATPDGLTVRRDVAPDEVAAFLASRSA